MRAWIAEARAGARRTCVFERFPMLFTASDSISRPAFIRVLSFLVVSMLRTFGRSQCGGDVDENAMLVVMAGMLVMRAKQ